MNKLIIATLAISLAIPKSCNSKPAIHVPEPVDEPVIVTIGPADKDLIEAIIRVESGGNDSAIGDRGKAVGCLQIHPICVREVNRILKSYSSDVRFSLADRYDRQKSIQMFNIIVDNYNYMQYNSFDEYAETIARRWNGGPRGDKKKATVAYWNKVEKQLYNINTNRHR